MDFYPNASHVGMQVGIFMLFPTFTLLAAIRAGTVHLHPLFHFPGNQGPAPVPGYPSPGVPPPPYAGRPGPPGQAPSYGYPAPGPATGYPVRPVDAQPARTDPNAALFAGHQSSAPV